MPIIHVEFLVGRSLEQKRELARALTDVVATIAKVDIKDVWVVIDEVRRENFAVGGELLSDERPDREV